MESEVAFYLQTVANGSFVDGDKKYVALASALHAAHTVAALMGCDVYVRQYVDGFGGDTVEIVEAPK